MKKIFFLLMVILVMISGCINLKDEYPEIVYYQLNPLTSSLTDLKPVNGALLIRNFSISSEYESKHLIANWDGKRVQKYYYHRWITDFSEMTTDFIFNRFSKLTAFSAGIIRSTSVIIPDYIIEGQVMTVAVNNSEEFLGGANNIILEVKVSVVKRVQNKSKESVLLNNVYTETVTRQNSLISSVAPAVSRAMSMISDKIVVDAINAISKSAQEKN